MDKKGCLKKVEKLTQEGAKVVLFPEAFIPTWYFRGLYQKNAGYRLSI